MKKLPITNREISWLSFNERVLQEAEDQTVPLIERIKFLAIFSSNMDEFFRVRVAALTRLTQITNEEKKLLGYSPTAVLKRIHEIVIRQQNKFNTIFESTIIPQLALEKIFLLNEWQLNAKRGEFVREYFNKTLLPTLVPIMVDGLKEFPYLKDKSVYLIVKLSKKNMGNRYRMALIEIPTDVHSRFLVLPETGGLKYIMMLDDVIRYCLNDLFSTFKYDYFDAYTIKLTRDAELDLDNDVNERFIDIVSKSLKQRSKGTPVRFVYDRDILPEMLRFLVRRMRLKKQRMIPGARYHNFKDYISFPAVGGAHLRYAPLVTLPVEDLPLGESFFSLLKKKDILIHLPYQSFDYVIQFLRESAIDPKVESIRITLYRLAENSRIVNALINAARNGKHVSVMVELKARFDEEANIYWANRLEEEGVRVYNGLPTIKIHSKICVVTRMEGRKKVYYAHLATGNYNEKTANLYCDESFFTADQRITHEVRDLFKEVHSGIFMRSYNHLMVAPVDLRKRMLDMIDQEIESSKNKMPAGILLKLNSLVDEQIIAKLYEASGAGVPITLIIRGICCLVPGVKGFSENIRVFSIIDRFLEHSRIYWFVNQGQSICYLSSADMMTRNLDRRLEVAFPIYDRKLMTEIKHIIDLQLHDNTKARIIDQANDNRYKTTRGKRAYRSQTDTYNYLKHRAVTLQKIKTAS